MPGSRRLPMMAEMVHREPFTDTGKITTAVVTGGHPHDVTGFHNLFRSMPEIDYYTQDLADFVVDWSDALTRYDVVLFFNFHLDTPPANEKDWWWRGKTKEALETLGEAEQGIVILHHARNAVPQWEFWSDLVGIPHTERTYTVEQMAAPGVLELNEKIRVGIADPEHPITSGLGAWDIYGETWDIGGTKPKPDCHTLLVTDHPKMGMKELAWVHQFRKSRVFCLQLGHNNDSYYDPSFRTVLSRGIQWVAKRL